MTTGPPSTRPMSRFICSLAARERDEPMFATASQVRRWLLVEVRGSWGSDAVADSELGHYAPPVWRRAMKAAKIRVVAVRRNLDDDAPSAETGVRLVYVTTARPGEHAGSAHRIVVDDLRQVVHGTECLLSRGEPDEHWTPDPDPYVLVCTNGRHDTCCATEGRPVVRHLRDTVWRDRIWESSHIGGDRFAGNLVLPVEGLYFGRVTPDTVESLLAGLHEGRLSRPHLRGRSTFTLLEQAAEHFVRERHQLDGVGDVAAARTVGDGVVELDLADGPTMTVTIDRGRWVAPTPLTCKGPVDQQVPSFRLVSID